MQLLSKLTLLSLVGAGLLFTACGDDDDSPGITATINGESFESATSNWSEQQAGTVTITGSTASSAATPESVTITLSGKTTGTFTIASIASDSTAAVAYSTGANNTTLADSGQVVIDEFNNTVSGTFSASGNLEIENGEINGVAQQ